MGRIVHSYKDLENLIPVTLTHLPGLFMDTDEVFQVGAASIARIEHDAWYELDGDYDVPVDWNDTQPVFALMKLTPSDDPQGSDAIDRQRHPRDGSTGLCLSRRVRQYLTRSFPARI